MSLYSDIVGVKCCAAVFNRGQVDSHYTAPVLSCTNEYLAIDNGGYLCMNSLRVLIAAWLDASQRS